MAFLFHQFINMKVCVWGGWVGGGVGGGIEFPQPFPLSDMCILIYLQHVG